MTDKDQRPRDWFSWLLANSDQLWRIVATGLVGVAGAGVNSGLSLLTIASWIVFGVAMLYLFSQLLRFLPAIAREIFVVAVAVLSGIIASGWCLGNDKECTELSAATLQRVGRVVNSTSVFVGKLWEEL